MTYPHQLFKYTIKYTQRDQKPSIRVPVHSPLCSSGMLSTSSGLIVPFVSIGSGWISLSHATMSASSYCTPSSFTLVMTRPWRVPATRPDPNFFLLPEPDPNYFSKFPSLGFFPAGCFPAGRFKSFNKNPQILFFSSRLDTKSSVSKLKCLRYKKWIQGKSGKFDNWFMMHFDLFQSRQSNPRFIHIEAIKSINQDGDKLLSD